MELTQDNIKKIDSFLQGIGVEYIDIRQEMVDHIASDIEFNVEDSEFFFEDNRFQSVYLKYLLSKKAKYLKIYKTIVSKKTKSDLTQILKDVLNHLLKTPVLLFIIVLSYLFVNHFKDSFVKELNIAMFLLVLAYIFMI